MTDGNSGHLVDQFDINRTAQEEISGSPVLVGDPRPGGIRYKLVGTLLATVFLAAAVFVLTVAGHLESTTLGAARRQLLIAMWAELVRLHHGFFTG